MAPIPGYFQTTNEGAPGPLLSGTGDATDLNPESARDAPVNPFKPASSPIRLDMILGKEKVKRALGRNPDSRSTPNSNRQPLP